MSPFHVRKGSCGLGERLESVNEVFRLFTVIIHLSVYSFSLAKLSLIKFPATAGLFADVHKATSSAYMARCVLFGRSFTMSLMYTRNRVGDNTSLCGTPCSRNIFLLEYPCTCTLALLFVRYSVIHPIIFPFTPLL